MTGNLGEGLPNDELPSLAQVYELYDNDQMQEFVDGAESLLERPAQLDRFHTIHLLVLLANSIEDPAEHLIRAEDEYRQARIYHDLPEEVRILDELGMELGRVRAVIQAEREEAAREEAEREEATDDLEEQEQEARGTSAPYPASHPAFCPALVSDGVAKREGRATDTPGAGRESSATQEGCGPASNIPLRPKPKLSKFESSLKSELKEEKRTVLETERARIFAEIGMLEDRKKEIGDELRRL